METELNKKLRQVISQCCDDGITDGIKFAADSCEQIAIDYSNEQNKTWLELAKAMEEYHNLLADELTELSTLADNRGWKSSRVEKGAEMRKQITELKSRLNQNQ